MSLFLSARQQTPCRARLSKNREEWHASRGTTSILWANQAPRQKPLCRTKKGQVVCVYLCPPPPLNNLQTMHRHVLEYQTKSTGDVWSEKSESEERNGKSADCTRRTVARIWFAFFSLAHEPTMHGGQKDANGTCDRNGCREAAVRGKLPAVTQTLARDSSGAGCGRP